MSEAAKIDQEFFAAQRTLKNELGVNELSGVAPQDRAEVVRLTRQALPLVEEWIKAYPIISPRRVASTCLAMAAMCPSSELEIIVDLSNLCLMLFAFDDVMDDVVSGTNRQQKESLLTTLYLSIVESGGQDLALSPQDSAQPWGQVASALAWCCRKIQTYPAATVYYSFFVERYKLVVKVTLKEFEWRAAFEQNRTLPTYDEFMAVADETIVMPLIASAAMPLLAQPLPADFRFQTTAHANLEALWNEVVLAVGRVVRLVNDIRGLERDLKKQSINSLQIRMEAEGLSEQAAEDAALHDVEEAVARLSTLMGLLPAPLKYWGESVARVCRFSRDFYLTREFHHFSPEMLSNLLTEGVEKEPVR